MPSKQTDLTDKAKLSHRARIIQALVNFCRCKKPLVEEDGSRAAIGDSLDMWTEGRRTAQATTKPQSSLDTRCIFYLGNQQLPLETRLFCFCRPCKAKEHVENVHLRHLNAPVH
jgi:hypothetical protein